MSIRDRSSLYSTNSSMGAHGGTAQLLPAVACCCLLFTPIIHPLHIGVRRRWRSTTFALYMECQEASGLARGPPAHHSFGNAQCPLGSRCPPALVLPFHLDLVCSSFPPPFVISWLPSLKELDSLVRCHFFCPL